MPWGSLSGMAFNYNAPAELFSTAPGVREGTTLRYDRFASAAEAIRHAVEQLHSAAELFWKSTRSVTPMVSWRIVCQRRLPGDRCRRM